MKNIIKYTGICFLFGALCLTSCEDYLDNKQHGVLTSENFYNTDTEAEQALASIYQYYATSGTQYNIFFLKNLLSDDFWCGGGGRGDNSQNEQLNEFTFNAEHAYLGDAFKNFYGIIYRANIVMENVKDESPVKKRAIAESKVFRAMAYIDLISMWGTPPYVDHVLLPAEYKQGNGNPAELWALVEKDLNEAISSNALKEKANVNDDTNYYITKQFAQALLGKALVFQGKFGEAATPLDAVINSGKYDLFRGDYGEILQTTAENNCESLFEFNSLNDPSLSPFDLMFCMTGWRTDKMTISSTADIYQGTWGYCVYYQKELYDAFVDTEGVNGYRLNKTMLSYDKLLASGSSIQSAQVLYGCEGNITWKARRTNTEFLPGAFLGGTHNNIRMMRYAEVLLLAAEAHFKAGDAGKAAQYVNLVRGRAQLSSKGSVTMEDIMLEKRLELCGESTRFQDMLRWKIAGKMVNQGTSIPTLNPNGTVTYSDFNTTATAGFKERHYLLPFPQTELTLNDNITQNAGW